MYAWLSHCATPAQLHVTFDSWDRIVTTAALLWISRKKQMDGFAMLKIHMNPFLCTLISQKKGREEKYLYMNPVKAKFD